VMSYGLMPLHTDDNVKELADTLWSLMVDMEFLFRHHDVSDLDRIELISSWKSMWSITRKTAHSCEDVNDEVSVEETQYDHRVFQDLDKLLPNKQV